MNMSGIITVNTTANIVNHVRTITAGMKSRIREITAQCLEIETTNIEVIYGVAE